MSERIGRRFAWTSASRLVAAVIQALTLAFLARWTSPGIFGIVASVLAVAAVAQVAFAFGVLTSVVRERSRTPDSPLVWASLRFNDWSAVALAGAFGLAIAALGLWVDPMLLQLLPLALWISTSRNSDTWLSVVFAAGDVWINAINQVATRLMNLALFVGLFVAGVAPVLAYSVSSAAVWIASSAVAHRLVRPRVTKPAVEPSIREVLTMSRPFWFHSLATQARQLDVVAAAVLAPGVQAGYYAIASRLVRPFRTLTTSLAAVMLPTASKRQSARQIRKLRILVLGTFVVTTVLYATGALLLPWLVPLVLGEQYAASVPTLQLVVLGLSFGAIVPLQSSVLQGIGLMRFVAVASVSSTLVCLVLVGVGAWLSGGTGAAIGLGLSFVLQAAALEIRMEIFARSGDDSHK